MRPLFELVTAFPPWEAVAARHGLSAWVADELARSRREVPPELQRAALAQVAFAARLKRLTHQVLDAFRARGVLPVLLKGYGLASRLFPAQPLARPSSDVDVLVGPSELEPAQEALAALGLAQRSIPGVEDEHEEHHHLSWSGPQGLVELHFKLFTGFGGAHFDEQAVLARARADILDGRPVRWLSPEDEFLYLATHAANHGFLRLSWLVDLGALLERGPALDWGLMRARAAEAGFVVPVATSLWLVEDLLSVRLPAGARASFPRSKRRWLGDRALFSPRRVASAELSEGRLSSFLLRLYLVDSPRQAGRHVVEGARRAWRQWQGG